MLWTTVESSISPSLNGPVIAGVVNDL